MQTQNSPPILLSACLAGARCRYDGKVHTNKEILSKLVGRTVCLVCPEVQGGLAVPRPPVRMCNGTGAELLSGQGKVIATTGEDFTRQFIEGARRVYKLALENRLCFALLKSRSPSCGLGSVSQPDGSTISGNGAAAELLVRLGIKVVSCEFNGLPAELPALLGE